MHWLLNAAVRAGMQGTKSVTVTRGTPLAKAWELVARDLRVSEQSLCEQIAPALRMQPAVFELADPNAKRLLPEKLARKYDVYAIRETDRELVIATADPHNYDAEQDIGFASGRRVKFELAAPSSIQAALDGAYSPDAIVESLLSKSDATLADAVRVLEEAEPEPMASQDVESAPLVKLANLILSDAIALGASDIHIEPGGAKGGAVRFRVDGVMRQHMALPMIAVNRIVSRIKVLGKLDIADRMRPQDGRTRILVSGKAYDLRISTIPTRDAEKVVVRILRPDHAKSLDEIGIEPHVLKRFRQLIGYRDGLVVVTGPTGSGKTTTLYAAVSEVANGEVNVMTVEDPIEYEIAGITQVQVEAKRNVTFASALRSILRQDPDVILVGEVRDGETAAVAAQAAATGHLVLATMHTNDAMSAVSRLADLGLDRATISAAFRGALAQRLLRRVCSHCVEPIFTGYTEEEERLAAAFGVHDVVRPVGCDRCNRSGYKGRIPLVEVAIATPSLAEQIAGGATPAQLQRLAVAQGMTTLRESAIERVRNRETTLAEVERVLGEAADDSPVAASGPPAILFVDDDAMLRHLASTILRTSGFRVLEARDGEQALGIVESGTDIALIVTDLRMPRMGGDVLVHRLRSRVATSMLPVIVLTGTDEHESELRLMEAGADDYIRKPIDPPIFLARVKAALRRAGVS